MAPVLSWMVYIAILGSCTASSNRPSQKPAAAAEISTGGFYWQLEMSGKVSHLLGTLPIGIDADSTLPQRVWSDLEKATTFVMEEDMTKVPLPRMYKKVGDKSNDLLLSEDHWIALTDHLNKTMKIQPQAVATMRLFVVANLLLQSLSPKTVPMDMALRKVATSHAVDIHFLQSPEIKTGYFEQYYTANRLSELVQKMGLLRQDKTSDAATTITPPLSAFVTAYTSGNTAAMTTLRSSPLSGLPSPLSPAQDWIPHIIAAVESGNSFVAINVFHTISKNDANSTGSIIDKLRQRGVVCTRVSMTRLD